MNDSFTRRDFLTYCAGVGASVAAASLAARSALAQSRARLTVSVRDGMLAHVAAPDCWAALKRIGAEGVEAVIDDNLALPGLFHAGEKYSLASDAGIARVRTAASAAGQKITALCMYNHFAERPDKEVQLCRRAAQAAQALGVGAIRIDVATQTLARPAFLALVTATLTKLMAATDSTGVAFAIENHGSMTNDPEFLRPLFADVGSKRLGLTLDTGNFYWYGHPLSKVYELYEMFAPRVFHTHCKSIGYPAEQREKQRPMGWQYDKYHGPIYAGDIDFGRVVAILKKAGYANDLCIENESLGKAKDAAGVLAKELRLLKDLR
ncbi:MAG: TIM barrel protein [Thermoguttaceae bacterium]